MKRAICIILCVAVGLGLSLCTWIPKAPGEGVLDKMLSAWPVLLGIVICSSAIGVLIAGPKRRKIDTTDEPNIPELDDAVASSQFSLDDPVDRLIDGLGVFMHPSPLNCGDRQQSIFTTLEKVELKKLDKELLLKMVQSAEQRHNRHVNFTDMAGSSPRFSVSSGKLRQVN